MTHFLPNEVVIVFVDRNTHHELWMMVSRKQFLLDDSANVRCGILDVLRGFLVESEQICAYTEASPPWLIGSG